MLGLRTSPKEGTLGFDLSASVDVLIADLERVTADLLVEIQEESVRYAQRVLQTGDKARREAQADPDQERWGDAFNALGEIQNFPRVDNMCSQYNAVMEILQYLKAMQALNKGEGQAPAAQEPKESKLDLPAKKKAKAKKGKKK